MEISLPAWRILEWPQMQVCLPSSLVDIGVKSKQPCSQEPALRAPWQASDIGKGDWRSECNLWCHITLFDNVEHPPVQYVHFRSTARTYCTIRFYFVRKLISIKSYNNKKNIINYYYKVWNNLILKLAMMLYIMVT